MDRNLPSSVNPGFLTCAPRLLEAFNGKCDLVLGGGTVLASRWDHRVSTDLAFFAYGDDVLMPQYIEEVGQELASSHHLFQDLTVHTRYLSFVCMDTNVSIFTTNSLTHAHSVEQESKTGLLLEATEEILAKKLSGRIMGLGDFLVRDVYDLCVASYLDADAYENALRVITKVQMADIASELKNLAARPPHPQAPLLSPKYPVLAENVWLHAQSLFNGRQLPSYLFTSMLSDDPNTNDLER